METLILKIGNHKINLQNKNTTLKKVKTVVNSYFSVYNLDKKETVIELPNGTKLKLSDLNTVKAFARVLFPAQFLDGSDNDMNNEFMTNLQKVQSVLYSQPINWDLVGTKDGKKILNMYKNAHKKAIETNVLESDVILIAG